MACTNKTADKIPDISFISLDVGPNNCSLSRELNITGTFESESFNGKAVISYVVDSADAQHIIRLGETDVLKAEGHSNKKHFKFSINSIDVQNISRSMLLNVGLLKLDLLERNNKSAVPTKEKLTVNIVTQIKKNQQGELIRTFFNPLEN
ncbi:hypothetical protein RFI_27874 [Reticulomyxa filosa]|uniref:Uncharacterized protein n=1 Tax=Reticulomyxa filosa TaxID=46433 RepID=X6M683_RETFI|nr:hypothetical protein RFI_27874 [Reticulomyxa filosa]|eukprot:ETO09503.1 hypothetical protein RFI_27874 [Reticulomyxa filosa]